VVKTSTSARSPLSPTLYPREAFAWYWSLAVAVATLFISVVSATFFLALLIVFRLATIAQLKTLSWPVILAQLFSYAVTLVVLYAVLPSLAKRPLHALGLRAPRLSDLAWGIAGAVAMLLFASVVGALQDAAFHVKPDEVQVHWLREARGTLVAGFIVLACVTAPVYEESVFRGFIFNAILRYGPPWFAIAFSACLFGLAHYQPGNGGALAPLAAGGVVLAAVYYRTGSLAASMTTHALFNLFTVVLVVVFHQT
jgi:membrane protease YdiL (CAAX protease family)